ncbi:hypothetical protein XaC1_483 [Xanthomonas phage XaC1]|nr:hypothetical protein XaC1_483 [Xanthomonas phage XaC1]
MKNEPKWRKILSYDSRTNSLDIEKEIQLAIEEGRVFFIEAELTEDHVLEMVEEAAMIHQNITLH